MAALESVVPQSLHSTLQVSLYSVDETSYSSLNIKALERTDWILSHVLTGQVITETRGVTSQADNGAVMLHMPHVPFSEMASGPGVHQWFAFDVKLPPSIDLFSLYPVSPCVILENADKYTRVFRQLHQTWNAPNSPMRDLLLFSATVRLFVMIIESWQHAGGIPRPPILTTSHDRFIEIVDYMFTHLDQKITRTELAERAFLHPGYFDRAFTASYGVSPMRMLRDIRLRRSQEMLERTEASLESIARSCGLGDATSFSRVFREHFGKAPGQYRESAKLSRKGYISPL